MPGLERLSPMRLLSQTLKRLDVQSAKPRAVSKGALAVLIVTIFLVAFAVRIFSWQDTRLEVHKVQTWVVEDYKQAARFLLRDGFASFFYKSSPLSDANRLGHPPGYSYLLAIVYRVFGESDDAAQFVQIACDSIAAVLIFLIAAATLPRAVAAVAAMLVALSPQLSYNSVLLLPDSIAVLPILLAVYCVVLAVKEKRRAVALLMAGALLGVSCWFRANALLLAPLLSLVALALFERGVRLKASSLILCGALLIIAPLTIRNALVLGYFVPVSLGAGQTLIEGIADYDRDGRFGMPATDVGVMRMEAESYNRPDYYGTLFNPDGVLRERMRMRRAFGVIRAHPVWFMSVLLRRGSSMLRLERSRRISASAPVTHSPFVSSEAMPAWSASAGELLSNGIKVSEGVEASISSDGQMLRVASDGTASGNLLTLPGVSVEPNSDYVLRIPVKVWAGGVVINVMDGAQKRTFASTPVLHREPDAPEDEQPVSVNEIAFTSDNASEMRVVLNRGDAKPPQVETELGRMELFRLGQASLLWTRYPRIIVRAVQELYLTAIMLPLELLGLALLIRARHFRTLALVLMVPFYYFIFQSPLHTEYRYVLAVNYFLFILAAVTLYCLTVMLLSLRRKSLFEEG